MRKFLAVAVLVPFAVIIVIFAVANREIVTISLDPLNPLHPAYALKLPLFVLIFVLVAFGVVVGGFAAWLRQHRWRVRARRAEAEARELRARLDAEPPRANVPAEVGCRCCARRTAADEGTARRCCGGSGSRDEATSARERTSPRPWASTRGSSRTSTST